MKNENYIAITTICNSHHISNDFIYELEECNLINVVEIENIRCIPLAQMKELEKFVRMHHELDINLPGIEAIFHLMQRLQTMEQKITILQQRLQLYESDEDLKL